MIDLTLPFPPSVNHYYRRVGPRTLISREGRAYRKRVCAILKDLATGPLLGSLRVLIRVHPPDARRRDLDNITKALLDALEHGGAYEDDSQIAQLEIRRGAAQPYGVVHVTIEELDGVAA